MLSKFASDNVFAVNSPYSPSFILYAITSYSSYNLKLTFEYTSFSLFPTYPSFTVIVGATLSYTNSYVVSFPAISFNVIVFTPYTNLSLMLSKFASDQLFTVTSLYSPSLILYPYIPILSYNLKLTFEYTFFSKFPTYPSFIVITGAVVSITSKVLVCCTVFPMLSVTVYVISYVPKTFVAIVSTSSHSVSPAGKNLYDKTTFSVMSPSIASIAEYPFSVYSVPASI